MALTLTTVTDDELRALELDDIARAARERDRRAAHMRLPPPHRAAGGGSYAAAFSK